MRSTERTGHRSTRGNVHTHHHYYYHSLSLSLFTLLPSRHTTSPLSWVSKYMTLPNQHQTWYPNLFATSARTKMRKAGSASSMSIVCDARHFAHTPRGAPAAARALSRPSKLLQLDQPSCRPRRRERPPAGPRSTLSPRTPATSAHSRSGGAASASRARGAPPPVRRPAWRATAFRATPDVPVRRSWRRRDQGRRAG